MRPLHSVKSAVPLLLLFGAGTGQTPPGQTTPAGRVCVAHNFGVPKTVVPYTTEDAIWNQDPGLLAEGPDGSIYSTSPAGGKYGWGAIWRYDPGTRQHQVVYDFFIGDTTGKSPRSGLVAAKGADGRPTGTFYGTAYDGGRWGVGTVFRYQAGAAKPQVLYHFRNGRLTGLIPRECPTPTTCRYSGRQRVDGAAGYPISAPVVSSDGTVYGVTNYSNNQGFGVLYKLGGGEEGLTAVCFFDYRMVADRDMKGFVCHPRVFGARTISLGNDGRTLYGTTTGGYGSIWSSTGGGIQVLHEFKLTDGSKPLNIMQASNGNLFGTTWAGGEIGAGTVYRFSTVNNSFQTLTGFNADYKLGSWIPGLNPVAGLVERLDTLNNDPSQTAYSLYGAAKFGGRGGRGTIYRMGLSGSDIRVVHHFPNGWKESGRSPLGALMLHSSGAIFGTTYQGGEYDGGVLWRLTGLGLPGIPNWTVAPKFTPGAIAKDDGGKPASDNLLTVRVGVCAYQVIDSITNQPVCAGGTAEGVKFEAVNCRNPHFVQFISREEIMTGTTPLQWRSGTTQLGYQLTTNPASPVWDVDVGRSTAADAFWENAPGNPVVRGPSALTNLDNPSMGPVDALKLGIDTDTRRATFRTYLYCNCELKRLVRWSKEKVGRAQPVTRVHSMTMPTAADQAFIDGLVKAQGFVPVP